jgi:Cu(I)/Ag(I) efflux system protein CusF
MRNFLLITLLAAVGAGSAFAQHESGGQQVAQAQAPAASQKTGKGTGLIQQIDQEKGAITIKHGPLQGLDMPAMTMSFLVKDKAMLSNLQPLQKVDFELTYDGRNYMITKIK